MDDGGGEGEERKIRGRKEGKKKFVRNEFTSELSTSAKKIDCLFLTVESILGSLYLGSLFHDRSQMQNACNNRK